jgi:hypothetical protein
LLYLCLFDYIINFKVSGKADISEQFLIRSPNEMKGWLVVVKHGGGSGDDGNGDDDWATTGLFGM